MERDNIVAGAITAGAAFVGAAIAFLARRRTGPLGLELDPGDFYDMESWEEAKEKKLGNMKKCALFTRVGHTNRNIPLPTGTYDICLSPNQKRVLFGAASPKRLGCGTFACAWSKGATRVVKITTDPDDVTALLEAQGLSHIVRVHKAYRLSNAALNQEGEKADAWALITERLYEPDDSLKQWINEAPIMIWADHFERMYGRRFIQPGKGDKRYYLSRELKDEGRTTCEWSDYPDECEEFMEELADTVEKLGKRGINWQDAHHENIGVTKPGGTVWKALDLGISGEGRKPKVKALRDARRMLRRLPRVS
jgi:hypothetical protein